MWGLTTDSPPEGTLCGDGAAYWVCLFSILWLLQIRPAVRVHSPPSLWLELIHSGKFSTASPNSFLGIPNLGTVVAISICIFLSQLLVDSLKGQLCSAPVCKHNIESILCQGLVPAQEMDSKLGWSLDSLSFSLCSIFVAAFLLDRNNSGLKFLRWVGGPIPLMGAVSIYSR